MEKINITLIGAGGGKTTYVAQKALKNANSNDKNIFAITFTNNATINIINKINYSQSIPSNLKISTIHSFLIDNIIKPFSHILNGEYFEKYVNFELGNNSKYHASKIKSLRDMNIMHNQDVFRYAKNLIVPKSNDRKENILIKNKIMRFLESLISEIFIDEAQDMDSNLTNLFKYIYENSQIIIHFIGDCKQDISGKNDLNNFIVENKEICNIEFINGSYRCPKEILSLSNKYIQGEKQVSKTTRKGLINVVYESDIKDLRKFCDEFDLKYIDRKNEVFDTHFREGNIYTEIEYEIISMLKEDSRRFTNFQVEATASYFIYILKTQNLNPFELNIEILNEIVYFNPYKNSINKESAKKYYAKIAQLLQKNSTPLQTHVKVESIHAIKGLESHNCLFIISNGMLPYLLESKNNGKYSNLLYVGITRSLEKLTLLITKEAEEGKRLEIEEKLKDVTMENETFNSTK